MQFRTRYPMLVLDLGEIGSVRGRSLSYPDGRQWQECRGVLKLFAPWVVHNEENWDVEPTAWENRRQRHFRERQADSAIALLALNAKSSLCFRRDS